ncbi:MAG: translation initiation factor IF-2 [Phycisphaerae bacterium]|nr:translation initiation factor IF-2 [Phycisphaerae bacterium]
MAKRIHQLAKELGIKSTAIVEKCQAEGLNIKNHMSTLSAGLDATIREWFSEGALTSTAVETTAKVDLDKVKSKPVRRRKKTEEEGDDKSEATVAVVDAPGVSETLPVEAEVSGEEVPAQEVAVPVQEVEVPVDQVEGAVPVPDVAVPGVDVETSAQTETEIQADSLKEKRKKPHRVGPQERVEAETVTGEESPAEEEVVVSESPAAAGLVEEDEIELEKPKPTSPRILTPVVAKKIKIKPVAYVPTPAVLKGPKVIRTERADVLPPPRPTRRPRPVPGNSVNGAAGPPMPSDAATLRKGRKKVVRGGAAEEAEARNKARQPKRRNRRYETEIITGGIGNRDIQERQARLAQASGTQLHRRERRMFADGSGSRTSSSIPRIKIEKATIKEPITVKDLSAAIGVRANEIIGKLMQAGTMVTVNQNIDAEAAETVAMEFGVELTIEKSKLLIDVLQEEYDLLTTEETLEPRPPVVAFLGHVDHGKTSLLDQIRKATVTTGEAGGITQHIGSYLYDDGKRRVTFLDTPGHKAFTKMRARGANMTDIAVLVVAADDGVMPQTAEAINHIKAANVPIVVALNKIDVPNADVNRALGQLSEKGLIPAEWGGDTEIVQTSAITGQGIDDLVEHLDYIAELNNLRSRAKGMATGWVIESEMNTSQGALARLLIKDGTLKPGDVFVSGSCHGRVRTIVDAIGNKLSEAGPAMPVEIAGLDGVPTAGDRFYVVDNISRAVQISEEMRMQQREMTLARRRQITLENLFTEIAAGEVKELNVIIKADVQGSVDVLRNSITELNTAEVAVRVLHAAVGGINESDVILANASNAIIIGFHVIADEHSRALAEKESVEIRLYRIIYKISDDIKLALEGMLSPRIEEKTLGTIEVRQIFRISRIGVIAGCYVTDGIVTRSAKVRVIRDNVVIKDECDIDSLRREKDQASEVRSGLECGIKLEKFDDLKVGDKIQAFELVKHSRTLEALKK